MQTSMHKMRLIINRFTGVMCGYRTTDLILATLHGLWWDWRSNFRINIKNKILTFRKMGWFQPRGVNSAFSRKFFNKNCKKIKTACWKSKFLILHSRCFTIFWHKKTFITWHEIPLLMLPLILHLASSEQWCWSGGMGILTELSLCYSIV